jgi:DNA-binding GntR family transcriptional regulator
VREDKEMIEEGGEMILGEGRVSVRDEVPTLEDAVVARIRRAILDGTYASGERLVEETLAERLGVSRNPVRAALRVLAAEGLVTIAPRRGATVTRLSHHEAVELFEIRAALDGLAARRAAAHHNDTTIAKIAEALETARSGLEGEAAVSAYELIDRFHVLVAEAGGNYTLARLIQPLADKVRLVHAAIRNRRAMTAWDEHARILQAIVDGDEDLAEELARKHVEASRDEYFRTLGPPNRR